MTNIWPLSRPGISISSIWPCLIAILLGLLLPQSTQAQFSLDSLRDVIENPGIPDSTRFRAMRKLGRHYLSSNSDSTYYYAKQQLSLAQSVNNPAWEAAAVRELGLHYSNEGDYEQAQASYMWSLALAETHQDTKGIATSLADLGLLFKQTGDEQQQLDYLLRSQDLWEELKDTTWLEFVYDELANYYDRRRQHPQLIRYLQMMISIQEKRQDSTNLARTYGRLGHSYILQDKLQEGLEATQQSLEIIEKLGEKSMLGGSYLNLGVLFFNKGDLNRAESYYQKCLEISEETGNEARMAGALINMGNCNFLRGDLTHALELVNQGLAISEDIGMHKYQAVGLHLTSQIYAGQENYDLAIQTAEKGLELLREVFGEVRSGEPLAFLSHLYRMNKQYPEALEYAHKMMALAEDTQAKNIRQMALTAMGDLHKDQQQMDSAYTYYLEAMALAREGQTKPAMADNLTKLGGINQSRGQNRLAIVQLEEALSLAKPAGVINLQAEIAEPLYLAYKATNQPVKALETLELARAVQDSLNNKNIQRAVLRNEFEQKALQDSLVFIQQQAQAEVTYEKNLAQRNYLLFALVGLGVLIFFIVRYRQQTRMKQRELELDREREKKKQLDQLNQMKSRFFANISHEFRTPLTLVLGQNQQLKEELDDPRHDPKFDRVDRNGRRLLGLVNQVLDLSKLEAGNMSLKSETLDLIPFLKNILFSFESLADQKQQALVFEHDVDSLLLVADPEKLERVFFNLLANAIKFTPERGQITLKLEKTAQRVRIGIIDTGIGIPEAQLPLIFDRFYQAEGGDTHPSPGTGIGLALAKELVELHQGQITVESQLREGTQFWLSLPLNPGSQQSVASYEPQLQPLEGLESETNPAVEKTPAVSGAQVLIVEDNPDVRAYLKDELLGLGYQVDEAGNGKEGLKQAKARQPDLIISDVMMPKMDGFEFVQAIRNDMQSSHIPIIMLTAKASDESKLAGLKMGADAYLTKPFNRTELEVRVSKLIEQRRTLRQRFSQAVSIRPEEVSAVSMDQAFIQQLTELIEANISIEDFGVENLSEAMAMSVTHLNRKLKALIGQSGGKLIRSMRLQRAADLLRQQAGTVSEIAYDMGFRRPNSFARAFKTQFGVSPKEYAASNEKT